MPSRYPADPDRLAGLRGFEGRFIEGHGAKVTSDTGLLGYRELDNALGLTAMTLDTACRAATMHIERHTAAVGGHRVNPGPREHMPVQVILPLILRYGFIVVGAFMMLVFAVKFAKTLKSRRWPHTEGALIRCAKKRIVKHRAREGETRYTVHDVEYEYWVHGQRYWGKRVTFSDGALRTEKHLDALLSRCRAPGKLTVYYNSRKPSESVLFSDIEIYTFTPLFLGVIFSGLGAYLLTLFK